MTTAPPAEPRTGATGRRAWSGVAAAACVLVAVAWWMTGPEPRAVDEGLPASPPPLALPTGEPPTSPRARAAAALVSGDLTDARKRFITVVAEAPNDPVGQVGLQLSGWSSIGPLAVERDLSQLALEYPESAFVALHLGMVRIELGDDRAARQALRDALDLGRVSDDRTELRMARLADDLLHPDGFAGYVPALVQVDEVRAADRPQLRTLRSALVRDDRASAATAAATLSRSSDAMAQIAAIVGAFDKDDPDAARDRLLGVAAARTDVPVAARDRARFLALLVDLWGGGERSSACRDLQQMTRPSVDPGTRRLAGPIHAELCATA